MSRLLDVAGLQVRYGEVTAVRDVSFHLDEGELVGIVGPNGAGKTTTVSALTGLIKPNAGTVALDGAGVVGERPERIARRGVGLVPEGRRIFATLSVRENLCMGAAANGACDLDANLQREFGRFPVLERYADQTAGNLSGGEQQQLAISRTLMADPRLVILDEPSLGLAPQMVDVVFDTLERLRDEGRSILLVEQNARQTIDIADRCYVFRQGEVVLELPTDEDDDGLSLAEAYLGAVV